MRTTEDQEDLGLLFEERASRKVRVSPTIRANQRRSRSTRRLVQRADSYSGLPLPPTDCQEAGAGLMRNRTGGGPMRFYNCQHRHYCGIDLHVRTMYVCILDAAGQVLVHRHVKSTPEAFLEIVAPYRDDLVVAAECMFTWYWLADVRAAEGIAFVLGHALAMKAIHGGKSKKRQDRLAQNASLLRGGLLPQSYVYPATMRSTRDLLRRRLHLVRKRGQRLAHIQNTRAQYNLPDFERRLAYPANRDGVPDYFPDPSVRTSIEVDLALLERYDAFITDLELTLVRDAQRHDAAACHRLQSVSGIRESTRADHPVRNS
ncbi:MAG: transposase [Acidobacteria bacterium]|nr:transposase [Acidobacteriota bacterium]